MTGATGVLLDIDGVLHVGDEPVPGAAEALAAQRERATGLRLVTNTTSKPRARIAEHLREIGLEADAAEILTPAAIAVDHCRARGYERVGLLVSGALREDLAGIPEAPVAEGADAIVLGELGDAFGAATLNPAFRALMAGAELVVLGHNRYYARPEGLVLDVGAWAAALEYAVGREGVVVGKPSPAFFAAALDAVGARAADAVMIGDDVEADVGGAIDAGLRGILVRTGKYRADHVAASGVEPTTTVDSIADVPELLWP